MRNVTADSWVWDDCSWYHLNWQSADNDHHIFLPAVSLLWGIWSPSWPATRDTQYGSIQLMDATLSTLITKTAATRRQLINRLTMFVTSGWPRYLGESQACHPHIFSCLSFHKCLHFYSMFFQNGFLYISALIWFIYHSLPVSAIFPSELIRTEKQGVIFFPSEMKNVKTGELCSSHNCSCQSSEYLFPITSKIRTPFPAQCSNYQCKETETVLMMKQWGVCVCGCVCNCV